MDIHLLETLNQELKQECEEFQRYLDNFNELPGSQGNLGPHMGVLTDRFIRQQLAEIKRFQKSGDRKSVLELSWWTIEAMETRKLFN
jgi:hypothetical protein